MKEKAESFEAAVIKRASVAAAPLAEWVKANIEFSKVVEKLSPLENDLKSLTGSLDTSRQRISTLQRELSVVDEKVERLRADFGAKTGEAESLKQTLEKTINTLNSSKTLLEKLNLENVRWKDQIGFLNQRLEELPESILISAAFVTYLGACTEEVRMKSLKQWGQFIDSSLSFELKGLVSSEEEVYRWKNEGLPSDALSIENAIIIRSINLTPIIVDPSGRIPSFLQNHFKEKKPEIVKQSDQNFMRSIELAVRFGKLLIVDEVTAIDPVIYPIIRKSFSCFGTRNMVQLGDKQVEVNDQFQLYFVTRNNLFSLPSELQGLMPEINFTVTKAGLSSQLLDLIITVENPKLETDRIILIKKEEDLNHTLVGLEDSLLQELANSVGNILENHALVSSLNETKAKSESIKNSLRESTALQAALDLERNRYSSAATTGSNIFFTLMNFSKINHMYQFSLGSFTGLFKKSIMKTNLVSEDSVLRLKEMRRAVLASMYSFFSRSVLNEDRTKLALSMIHSDYPELFKENEWDIFLGLNSYDGELAVKAPAWVPSANISAFQKLLARVPSLKNSINMDNTAFWNGWMTSTNCEMSWGDIKIHPFQKILLIQALRPDRLVAAISLISTELLGITSLSPQISYSELITDSACSDFTLFVATPGVDPSLEIKEYAKSAVGEKNYYQIAMGQGQGEKAIALLSECAEKGSWLFLQNLHLVINWIPVLEAELGRLTFHENFKLWISTEEHPNFPSSLLSKCLKITVQAPPGIKKNLERTYENWNAEFIQSGNLFRAQALFGLAWFHSIVQERRNYLPQGWVKFYEFSSADLKSTAVLISDMFKKSNSQPSWEVIRGLIHEAIYGGRIDVAQDYICLKTLLEMYFRNDYYRVNESAPKKKFNKIIELPNIADRGAFIEMLKLLPERDDVQTLGLPANANCIMQQIITAKIIESLKLLVIFDVFTF